MKPSKQAQPRISRRKEGRCATPQNGHCVSASAPQKLHIRKDHIHTKNFGKKKLSNRHAFTGELAVKVSQNKQSESPRRIQRVSKDTYLSYQSFTYPNSTYTNLQSKRWKWHHPTGIHLAVALESNGFLDTLGYGAYPNRIF